MTEPTDPTPADRAERAFRDAFVRHADQLEPAALAPVVRRRRGRVLVAAVAVAAVVVAAASAASVLRPDEPGPTASVTGPSDTGPSDTGPSDTASATPAADVRTVSFLDVALEVPAGWPNAYAPTDQWCIADETDFPTEPYVALDGSSRGSTDVGCSGEKDVAPAGFPPVPLRFWAPHLSLLPARVLDHRDDGVATFGDWTLTTRTVGDVRVELLTDAATTGLVDGILDTAVVRDTDPNGCDTTSPAQAEEFVRPPAFEVDAIDTVTDITVCQYGRRYVTGLLASRVLSGSAAQDELDAIKAAPSGGGPDHPENCAGDLFGDQAIVLRLRDGERTLGDLYVYYDWCFGNGIDDGTTRRSITEDSCSPLWGNPVYQYSGDGSTFELCHPENRAD